MLVEAKETSFPASECGSVQSPRIPHLVVRRSRRNSNNSETSTGSGKSHDVQPAVPGMNFMPVSAPGSRSASFRDRPTSRESFRHSPCQSVSNEGSKTSNTTIALGDTSSQSSSNKNNDLSMGPRQSSMPSVAVESLLRVPISDEAKDTRLRRIRSFKTTSKGLVVNRGDSFKKKSTHSLMSAGSAITDARPQQPNSYLQQSNVINNNIFLPEPPVIPTYYRVIMMGAAGCGKTLLTQQFMTSDYVGSNEDNHDIHEKTVIVLLDGEESTIQFIDPPNTNVILEGLQQLLDAYVVVFAINDHSSFECAKDLVRYLRVDHGTDRVIVLVANKIDLVRKRKVSADEARLIAETYDCKYTETSAALNHFVDELLVGILTQIRLHMRIPFTTISFPGKEHMLSEKKERRRALQGPRGFFSRLFRRSSRKKMKPCENLYSL